MRLILSAIVVVFVAQLFFDHNIGVGAVLPACHNKTRVECFNGKSYYVLLKQYINNQLCLGSEPKTSHCYDGTTETGAFSSLADFGTCMPWKIECDPQNATQFVSFRFLNEWLCGGKPTESFHCDSDHSNHDGIFVNYTQFEQCEPSAFFCEQTGSVATGIYQAFQGID